MTKEIWIHYANKQIIIFVLFDIEINYVPIQLFSANQHPVDHSFLNIGSSCENVMVKLIVLPLYLNHLP